ncbi:MAG TPA: 16S rRNA (adenine(1518)-N(6)/adenine(1519)-N(6))-dimethyltransferase RsmA [Micavibrio sp.]|nr:16S rRNA (adenine(1518)-N(6)/adenine(1519)-N(6))-dimethyltransferase RsmA [Micavibrio sp.]
MTAESEIAELPPLREVIREHGLRAEKSLGQNFLLDLNLTGKIARAAKTVKGACVFEIGPGPGGLTRAILESGAKKLIAIEYDQRAVAALQGLKDASGGRLDIVHADALHADLPALAEQYGLKPPYAIVANLPYNIATPLLTGWLEQIHADPAFYCEMVLMFQKEVAQRIVAKPSTKAYGRLSILAQWLCEARLAFDVPAAAFTPPPKVTSSIVRLVPRKKQAADFAVMEKLTAAAFGQRRKMIRGSLKEYMPYIEQCGLRPDARAEELSVADFARLAEAVTKAPL